MFPWNFSPFHKDMLKQLKQMKPDEVEKNVQEMMGKMFSSNMQGMDFMRGFQDESHSSSKKEEKKKHPETKIFEAHDDVYIQIPIKNREALEGLKISHTSNLLMIAKIGEEEKQTIPLPCIVKKKGARAYYKDGVLEIKIPKSIDFQFSEIDIQEKY